MAKFLMLGKYPFASLKSISAARTQKAVSLIKKFGGKVNSIFALLGNYDLALMVDFPGIEEAMRASISLTKLTSISFATYPAVTMEQFDKMLE